MTQTLELSDKDVRAEILKMFLSEIMNTLETNEKRGSLSKEMEDIKKNQTEILELKA